jgi:hypothetical protein
MFLKRARFYKAKLNLRETSKILQKQKRIKKRRRTGSLIREFPILLPVSVRNPLLLRVRILHGWKL